MKRNKSAIKQHRQSLKRRERNIHYKSAMRTFIKRVRQAVETGDSAEASSALGRATRFIDKVAGKGIVHRRNAARKISRLVRAVTGMQKSG